MKKYAYGWLTAIFFLVSIAGHWVFGWFAYVDEVAQHGQQPQLAVFAVQIARDTFENWQSEFLQLIWQVVGLAYFLYVGSPSSIDALLKLSGREGEARIADLDRRYMRVEGHAKPHGRADR